jgi:predicted pyridoxine 5'-phosphate oxidase superfamily flavin-nucleotide-binding protein
MTRAFTEISFTPSVLALQTQNGSAEGYSKFMATEADRADRIGPAEAEFISGRDGFYQATVSETGWPYVQFRGGPTGFLKVLDDQTIAYADFRGNRQYLSAGNLTDDDRLSMILMDYPNRRRLKIWGRAKLTNSSDDTELMTQLQDMSYRGRPERAVVITVEALDWNCPQHIPQRMTMEELEPQLAPLRTELSRLNSENEKLRSMLGQND